MRLPTAHMFDGPTLTEFVDELNRKHAEQDAARARAKCHRCGSITKHEDDGAAHECDWCAWVAEHAPDCPCSQCQEARLVDGGNRAMEDAKWL